MLKKIYTRLNVLNATINIENGALITDLFVKPTDTHQLSRKTLIRSQVPL